MRATIPLSVALGLLPALLGSNPASEAPPTLPPPAATFVADELGHIVDREGNARIRPRNAERWDLATAGRILQPGDWVKTGTRGANAVVLELAGGARLTLGPAGLLEIGENAGLRLLRGELEVVPSDATSVAVEGPVGAGRTVEEAVVLRASDSRSLEILTQEPRWLVGYKTDTSTDALGSLLANVDGRNEPLTMGYHKVVVDIRDQIARTTVEESFVNHTHHVLEGVFYFPLPADASISGFAMWIGDEKVEGEIVEKQRAREIYETILAEKRDPGLLEWTGGNIFKARVYPIGNEKRIQITYTQVLPKAGDTFSYRYALRSELTRLTPLERLEIDVRVSSARGISSVTCPTHACRIQATAHAAQVEFSAEDWVPRRDFEVRVRTPEGDSPLTVVSHRRGDDGYFLLLADAPQAPATEQERGPLECLFLVDTSGSMAGPQRDVQLATLEAILEGLGTGDRFRLYTVDTEVRAAFDDFVENDRTNGARAISFVEDRHPLGWTDLEAAFRVAFETASEGTRIIYLGDGVVTRGDTDPAAFLSRVERLWEEGHGTVHTVAVGSSQESLVMEGLARLGGGSSHTVAGGLEPAVAADRLLQQMVRPGVRNVSPSFSGIDVAAVYPDQIGNLATGTQAVIVGRWDPKTADAASVARVRGTLDGQEVEWSVPLAFADADRDNSFLPRLWARRRLDHLLRQGASPGIRAEIIGLSEDFQIMTPYTSFLVLESEADRERFRVKKRFRMRDGEEFFTEGRDRADFELTREQMKIARLWRLRLRAGVLQSLEDLGRELTEQLDQVAPQGAYWHNEFGAVGVAGSLRSLDGRFDADLSRSSGQVLGFESEGLGLEGDDLDAKEAALDTNAEVFGEEEELLAEDVAVESPAVEERQNLPSNAAREEKVARTPSSRKLLQDRISSLGGRAGYAAKRSERSRAVIYPVDPFDPLFPVLPGAPGTAGESGWPDEIRELVRPLNRRPWVAGLAGGVEIGVTTVHRDGRLRVLGEARGEHLLSAEAWWVASPSLGGDEVRYDWHAGGERGAWTESWLLGRVRKHEPGDERGWGDPFAAFFRDLSQTWGSYEPSVTEVDDGRVLLTLRHPNDTRHHTEVLIDPERALVLEIRSATQDELISTTSYDGFVSVAGAWLPRSITTHDAEGRTTAETRVTYDALGQAELARRLSKRLARRSQVVLLGEDPRSLVAAKQAVSDGQARLEDHWALLRELAARQNWEPAQVHLDAVLSRVAGLRGQDRIRLAVLLLSRRNEEVKALLHEMAASLASEARGADRQCALELYALASVLHGNERLQLVETLKPVHERQERLERLRMVDQEVLECQQTMGWSRAALATQLAMTQRYPFEASLHAQYATAVAALGDVDDALRHLRVVEAEHQPWRDHEILTLRQSSADILINDWRLADMVELVDAWQEERADQVSSWVYNQYLSALIMLDRDERADSLITEWLDASRALELDVAGRNRRDAAVQHALGTGWNMWRHRYDDRWSDPLAKVARFYAGHGTEARVAGPIVSHEGFGRTREGQKVRDDLYAQLKGDDDLPLETYALAVSWLRRAGFTTDAGEAEWQENFRAFLERWIESGEDDVRQLVQQVVTGYGETELQLRYWRHRIDITEDEATRVRARRALFDLLVSGPWTEGAERELVSLLPLMGSPGAEDVNAIVVAIWRFASWLPEAWTRAEIAAHPDANLWTRRELQREREQAMEAAREHTARLLHSLEPTFEPRKLAPWIRLERICVEVKRGGDVAALAAETTEILRSIAPDGAPSLRDLILAERTLTTLAYLAIFSDDGEPLANDLLGRLDERIALEVGIPEENRLIDARDWKARMLLALDRARELEEALRTWYGDGDEFAAVRWGRLYAYVLAERGEVTAAVDVLLGVEAFDELTAEDYVALADWHKLLGSREKERASRIRSFETMNEWELSNVLQQDYALYSRSGDEIPSELDPLVPVRFVALFRVAQHPESYMWLLRNFYEATRDFRLLECASEAMLGQSAQRVYPLLEQMTYVTNTIQDEATLDRLTDHAARLRGLTESDVDRRALWMLEFFTRHRALQQRVGTEKHVQAVILALREARNGEWADGEPEMMARVLGSLSELRPQAVHEEVLRQLVELQTLEPRGSVARFRIAFHRAGSLWTHGQREDATQVAEAAIRELREAEGQMIPPEEHERLATYVGWLRELGRYREGELFWAAEREHAYPARTRLWLQEQLLVHYGAAVLVDAEVSLGRGSELYYSVEALYDGALAVRTNEQHARNLIAHRVQLWNDAWFTRHIPEVEAEVVSFAFHALPYVLDLYDYRNGQSMISQIADPLRRIAGPATTVRFLLERAENERRWLRLQGGDFWPHHAHELGRSFHEAGELDEPTERRLLAVVIRELNADLTTQSSRSPYLYHDNYSWFWSEKADVFADAARSVIRNNQDSEGIVRHAAAYLYHGLERADLAIAALLDANRRGDLSLDGRMQLCEYLQWEERWEESIPILAKVIREDTDRLEPHRMLMRAYFHTGEGELVWRALESADEHFHGEDRWREHVIAALGEVCLETELFERCIAYYDEAIALHVRTAPNRGVGDGVLAPYYRNLAGAYGGLGRTAEAVDACGGAIAAWGRSEWERGQALGQLEEILTSAKDLDDYVGNLDIEVEATGLENPLVRKALGKVYLSLDRPHDAARQLERAVDVRPEDLETQRLLVEAYDRSGDPKRAAAQMLAAAEEAPREIRIYKELGDRWLRTGRPREAERAYTSIVEAMPNESESHQLLADVRARQGRWQDARLHWNEVVSIRSLEPTGYLGLARTLIELGDWDGARATVDTLRTQEWPERFGDLSAQIRELENRVTARGS